MIITKSIEVHTHDLKHYAWTGLRQFENLNFTTNKLRQYQSPPIGQEKNVKKQAQQIRYCIGQADEYFRAAQAVGLATKPLLLYYGAMSLALAEILIKQNGNSSLDKARGQHAHHGLDLRIDRNPSLYDDLSDSASFLRAVPLLRSSERFGTFELWHRTSRETPLFGERETIFENGHRQTAIGLVGTPRDEALTPLPDAGISLLDCFRGLPQLNTTLSQHKIVGATARGTIKNSVNELNKTLTYVVIIHPSSTAVLDPIYEGFLYPPSECDQLDVVTFPNGCIITTKHSFGDPQYGGTMPFGFQEKVDRINFSGGQGSLNKLGLMYVALFILGSYARYFPDQWMVDVEGSSTLALVAGEFLALAERKLPLLSLSELMQTWYLFP